MAGPGRRRPGAGPGDLLSDAFTVTACEPGGCDITIAQDAVNRYKRAAAGPASTLQDACVAFDVLPDGEIDRKALLTAARDFVKKRHIDQPDRAVLVHSPPNPGGLAGFVAWGQELFEGAKVAYGGEVAMLQALAKAVTCRSAQMYDDIVKDPPRDDFDVVSPAVEDPLPRTYDASVDAVTATLERGRAHGAAGLVAFERLQGAGGFDAVPRPLDRPGVRRQAAAMAEHDAALALAMRQGAEALRRYADELSLDAWYGATALTQADVDAARPLVERLRATGWRAEELAELRRIGLDDVQADGLRRRIAGIALDRAPVGRTLPSLLSTAAAALEAGAADVSAFARTAKAVTDSANRRPQARFTVTPAQPQVGRAVAFDGSGSSDPDGPLAAHEWDLDGDGVYDVRGPTAATAFRDPGDHVVTLRVTDGNGVAHEHRQTVVIPGPQPALRTPPAIDGIARDGELLTADVGAWDNDPAAHAHQWQRCDRDGEGCTDLPDAAGGQYRVVAQDVGGRLRVRVTATNDGGSATASSAPTDVVAALPPVADAPPLVGGPSPPGEGVELTAGNESFSGTQPQTLRRGWLRCEDETPASCTPIAGADDARYVVREADLGKRLRATATSTNTAGTTTATSEPTEPVVVNPPIAGVPAVEGRLRRGDELRVREGDWRGSRPVTFAYQWRRCTPACADLPGADGPAYVPDADDVGHRLQVLVVGRNASGEASAESALTGVVADGGPSWSALPALSGRARQGRELATDGGTWQGTPALAHQWLRCDADGTADSCRPIAGATGPRHLLTAEDVDHRLRVRVTATLDGTTTVLSGPSGFVLAPLGQTAAAADTLFYSTHSGGSLRRASYEYDGSGRDSGFRLGEPVVVAEMVGSDGVVFAPDGDAVVGVPFDRVHKVDRDTGEFEAAPGGGGTAHVALDPRGDRVWGSYGSTALDEYSLRRFPVAARQGPAVRAEVDGEPADPVMSIAFDRRGNAFYSAETTFGRIDLETMRVKRLLQDMPGAHGMVFDPYTGDFLLFGGDLITQIRTGPDDATGRPGSAEVVSRFSAPGHNFDQGTADGQGHAFVADLSQNLYFVDYRATKLVGAPSNLKLSRPLERPDDIAPLAGPGAKDTRPPLTVALRTPGTTPSGWNATDVVVDLAATDDDSGVTSLTVEGTGAQAIPRETTTRPSTSRRITASGATTLRFRATDAAGHVEPERRLTVQVDRVQPDVELLSPAAGTSVPQGARVVLQYACSDALSGIASCRGTGPGRSVPSGQPIDTRTAGTKTVTVTATDRAGNTRTATRSVVVRDVAAPSSRAVLRPPAPASGWHLGDVAVDVPATDNDGGTGVAGVRLSGTGAGPFAALLVPGAAATRTITAEGTTRVAHRAEDRAGNAEPGGEVVVRIDRRPPEVAITSPAEGQQVVAGTGLAAAYRCTDAASAIASCTGDVPDGAPLDTAAAGPRTLRVTATDVAGRTTTASRSFSVVRPADPPPPPPSAGGVAGTTQTAPSAATPPSAPATTPAPLEAAKVVTLPPARRCVSRRRFSIRLREPKGTRFVKAVVSVNGRRLKVVEGARLKARIDLTGLPKGRFTVVIVATTADGRTVRGTRRYRTCAPRGRR